MATKQNWVIAGRTGPLSIHTGADWADTGRVPRALVPISLKPYSLLPLPVITERGGRGEERVEEPKNQQTSAFL